MRLVLFTHPTFLASQSMPRFARQLTDAYRARGIDVTVWCPTARFHKLLPRGPWSKWLGYVDQYVLFPVEVRRAISRGDFTDTVFVFCDQALGPWVPLVRKFPNVVHCHDLMALRSALGQVPENPVSLTGRLYQRYIRRGFRHAANFICVSEKSRADLVEFGFVDASRTSVVYNELHDTFSPLTLADAAAVLAKHRMSLEARGILLHVGGGQWYKNTAGVIHLYGAYARSNAQPPELWMVSPPPDSATAAAIAELPPQARVRFLSDVTDEALRALYSVARAFLFPSLDEGFGWPIIEAMACGCPVITTEATPMTEVGGDVATYLPRLRSNQDPKDWARSGAAVLNAVLTANEDEARTRRSAGIRRAALFRPGSSTDRYLEIYRRAASGAAVNTVFSGISSP